MTQSEKRLFLIKELLSEQTQYRDMQIPQSEAEQKRLLRSLMNIRKPTAIGDDFLAVQDEYLQSLTARKGITDIADIEQIGEGIYLWQGDITTLRCDAMLALTMAKRSAQRKLKNSAFALMRTLENC